MKTHILNLFPTPIVVVENFISVEECDLIVEFFKDEGTEHIAFEKNATSTHGEFKNCLKDVAKKIPKLSNIEKNIDICLINYVKILGIDGVALTNSWVNFQHKDSVLKEHTHGLSTVSGTLFLKSDSKSSNLNLFNQNPYLVLMRYKEMTNFNTEYHYIPPNKGNLVLFPSWLKHGSNGTKNMSESRVVLSFNAA